MAFHDYKKFPFEYLVAEQSFAGVRGLYIFGHNDSVGTAEETVWHNGGQYSGFITSPSILGISSSSADDDGIAGNSGAHEVTIFGLDQDWHPIEETFILNGTTEVTSTSKWFRIHKAKVVAGNDDDAFAGPNHGNITITANDISGTPVMNYIAATEGVSHGAFFTMPVNRKGFLLSISSNTSKGNDLSITLKSRKIKDDNSGPWQTSTIQKLYQNSFYDNYTLPRYIPEKTDLMVTAVSSNTGVPADATMQIVVMDGQDEVDEFYQDIG